jgi:hypothetical protein
MRYFKAVYIWRITNNNILLEFKQISCFLLGLLNVAKAIFVFHVGEFPQTCSMSPCNSTNLQENFSSMECRKNSFCHISEKLQDVLQILWQSI